MSESTPAPIRFLLSDMDGTLLLPDHSLSQRYRGRSIVA